MTKWCYRPSGRTARTVKRDNERLGNAQFLEFFNPFFGIGGSEWHRPDDRYQDSAPANAVALPAIGVTAMK